MTGPPKDKFLAPPLPVKLVIPTPRVVLEGIQEDTDSINNEGRLSDLGGGVRRRARSGKKEEPEVPVENG